MADCSKCNRTDIKCCHTCKKDAEKCNVWHLCGGDCPEYEAKTITNADRIRSMTDEELAEFLQNIKKEEPANLCSSFNNGCWYSCKLHHCCHEKLSKLYIKWLQSEPEPTNAEWKQHILNRFEGDIR